MTVPVGAFEVSLDLATDDGIFIRWYGTDRWRSKVLAHNITKRLIVVKIPGRHVYSGQGAPWTYAPTTYEVLELNYWPRSDDQHVLAWPILDWSHWQAAQS